MARGCESENGSFSTCRRGERGSMGGDSPERPKNMHRRGKVDPFSFVPRVAACLTLQLCLLQDGKRQD